MTLGRWRICLLTLAAMTASCFCMAAPDRLIITRHGEKLDKWDLCQIGWERAHALNEQYLGKLATSPLFVKSAPAAIMSMTLHTTQTAQPTAQSWGMPITNYAALAEPTLSHPQLEAMMNRQNQQAVHDLLTAQRYKGQQVLMVWEHFHIASAALEARYPDEAVTLRQLLKLNQPPFADQVPATWPDSNYNFFWIVDFNPDGSIKAFNTRRQIYNDRFSNLPDNTWDAPNNLPTRDRCLTN